MDAQFWDERYRSHDQLFSGAPNGVLVAEVADLVPGRALDIGAGEGGDALWLAERGWQVTAIDLSTVALERGARAAAARGVADRIRWRQGDLTKEPPTAAAYDLVSAQYFPLPRQPEHTALHGLLEAVAADGTLLIASHAAADLPPGEELGFDPSDYYWPEDIARLLDHNWTVLVNETRPRTAPAPAGTRHAHDTVIRAQRQR